MAMSTVEIATADGLASHIATVLVNGRITMVLVLMVPHMLLLGWAGGGRAFVLAIAGHCCPTELQRQEEHEEDKKPAAHNKCSLAARP